MTLRGFRNLQPVELELPPEGAVLLGANAQGKTNLLEAIGYPVLFRALRGALDSDVAAFGGPGFRLEAAFHDEAHLRSATVTFHAGNRRKQILLDGAPVARLSEAVGAWVAVAFLPRDVALAAGPASERRQYLDRMLSLASPGYLRALGQYREALRQRNAALRTGQEAGGRAFEAPLAEAGAEVVRARLAWATGAAGNFALEFAGLGEAGEVGLAYRGPAALSDASTWPEALERTRHRDAARGLTSVGPHRDDLAITIGAHPIREFGSTGQVRGAAVALKLLEVATIEQMRGVHPALLLDDVFAELDADRQARLAARLATRPAGQLFVTAPRHDELPAGLALPVWAVQAGAIRTSG